jgi:hypothetical protein
MTKVKLAAIRDELRPHGVLARDCPKCALFPVCGGTEPKPLLHNMDCFHITCCKFNSTAADVERCDCVCPHNSRFVGFLREVGGDLSCEGMLPLRQNPADLPLYVPLIHHGYSHQRPLNWPVVALDTYQVVKLRSDRMETVANDPAGLRSSFGLAPTVNVILRGVANDPPLERYWSYRRRDAVPQQIARLGVLLAVGPNFSHFLDVPRPETLFNRKRQLICLNEFSAAGINPVPHLSAAQPADWAFWSRFVTENSTVVHVAAEFETGNRSPTEGRKVIRHITELQQSTGRPLHPLVIGGTQFLEDFARHFDRASFVDSTPFIKAMHRHKFVDQGERARWQDGFTLIGQGVDDILEGNLGGYSTWLSRRWDAIKCPPTAPPLSSSAREPATMMTN